MDWKKWFLWDDKDLLLETFACRLGWWDRLFLHTGGTALVLFAFLLAEISWVFGLLGLFFCQAPRARWNAMFVLAVSCFRVVLVWATINHTF